MPVRLRFALHGTRHKRVFHLVAIHKSQRRDAKPTETLGIYNPHMTNGQTHKTIEWSVDRIRYWLHVGAVPSKSVSKLLEMGNILKKPSRPKASNLQSSTAASSLARAAPQPHSNTSDSV
ncbi:ribosomal protein S16 [Tricholoma matsutake]|nr:ribosomal protein S16 [Tricholoma matsutake 945]